jgi:hypothetical protein
MIRRYEARALVLAVAGTAAASSSAHAIPVSARKYNVSCALCNDPAPRLNAFGEQFAANGFEFVPAEPPRDTGSTGDEQLRLLPRIPAALPLSDRYPPSYPPSDPRMGDAAFPDLAQLSPVSEEARRLGGPRDRNQA